MGSDYVAEVVRLPQIGEGLDLHEVVEEEHDGLLLVGVVGEHLVVVVDAVVLVLGVAVQLLKDYGVGKGQLGQLGLEEVALLDGVGDAELLKHSLAYLGGLVLEDVAREELPHVHLVEVLFNEALHAGVVDGLVGLSQFLAALEVVVEDLVAHGDAALLKRLGDVELHLLVQLGIT